MNKPQIIHPEGWPSPRGYSTAILVPRCRTLHVAGMVGWDTEGRFPETFAEQFKQALLNVKACVEAAGSSVEYIGRMTIYVTDKLEYEREKRSMGEGYREIFGKYYPAMALVEVQGLLEEGAKVEIEADAVVPDPS
jgi:enamine deaminase RidA (YjgF/YER057c/UK114 family)